MRRILFGLHRSGFLFFLIFISAISLSRGSEACSLKQVRINDALTPNNLIPLGWIDGLDCTVTCILVSVLMILVIVFLIFEIVKLSKSQKLSIFSHLPSESYSLKKNKEGFDYNDVEMKKKSIFIENSFFGIIEWDPEMKVIEWNSASSRIFGYDKKDAIGRCMFDKIVNKIISVESPQSSFLNSAVGKTESFNANGGKIICEWYNTPIIDEAGILICIVSSVHDITEKENAIRMLEQTQKQMEAILGSVSEKIVYHKDGARILWGNDAAAKAFGVSKEDMVGHFCHEIAWDQDKPCGNCPVIKCLKSLKEENAEIIRSNGAIWQVNAYPVFSNDKLDGVVSVTRDITLQRLAEETLKNNEERLRLIINAVSDGIVVMNKKRAVLFANPAAEELLGCSCGDIKSKDECFLPESGVREFEIQGEDGVKTIEVRGSEITWAGLECYLCSFRDLTKRKKAERELLATNKMLEELNLELQQNRTQLVQSEKLASIGQLAAGVAHEINNPIAFVNGNLGVLKDYCKVIRELLENYNFLIKHAEKNELEKLKDVIDKIKLFYEEKKFDYILEDLEPLLKESLEGTERVREIVNNLKTFARMDEGELKEYDLNEGIKSTLKIVWNELKYKCEVVKDLQPLPRIRCYPGQLNQVFMNLLVNAAHSIEEKGIIRIESFSDGKTVTVKISDTGKGIPEENLNKLFDPFFTTKEVGKGTGLGLSISHGIIEKHHGRIEVDSKVGEGTTFTVILPV